VVIIRQCGSASPLLSRTVRHILLALIFQINAITLGLETMPTVLAVAGDFGTGWTRPY
jgi:hypothetical protein